jgi:hypothetical protein
VPDHEEIVGAEAILVPINYKDRTSYRERIKDLCVDKDDKIKKAAEALKALGFVVAAKGVISITILGKRQLFEKVFQVKLNRITPKSKDNNENTLNSKSSYYYYVLDGKVKIPKELEGLVFDVVFSIEPTFM